MGRVKRDGAQHGAPYRQSDLDSLCGLYATVNALRVALAPTRALKRREAQELFVAGLAYLNRASTLHKFSAAGSLPPPCTGWPGTFRRGPAR